MSNTPFLFVPTFSWPAAPFGLLYAYQAGSTTPKTTYSDAAGIDPNTNPVELDATGSATIRLGAGSYKFVLLDQTNTVTLWEQDNYDPLILTQQSLVAVLNPQTTTETSLGIVPTALQYLEGDIRRYGALIASADNSTAINSALAISAVGGSAAFIPAGNWNITSTLIANSVSLTGASSMYGTGQQSVIIPTGCDGITFSSGQSANAGARFFRDFSINGPSTTTSSNNGITINLASGKIVGVQFSNLVIQNFAKGVFVNGATGLWNSAFVDCWLANNYQGYYIFGQAVLLNIRGGFVSFAGGTMTGTGTKYGFFTQDNAGGNLQSLHMQGVGFYNYDQLLSFVNPVYVEIENCDLSLYNVCGVFVGGRTGAFAIRDCWIQAALLKNNSCGIFVEDLGSALLDKIIIDGNSLYGNAGTGTCGIYLSNGGPTSVTNNTIGSSSLPFVYGIGGNTPAALGTAPVGTDGVLGDSHVIANNTIYASTTAIQIESLSTNVAVLNNTTQHGTACVFSTTANTPVGFQYQIPGMKGSATFVAGTAVGVTIPTMPNSKYVVLLGGNAAGYVYPTSPGASSFTITCSNSNSNATGWAISY